MKIALISPYANVTSFGIRTISSYLKQMNHQTKLIFLPISFHRRLEPGTKRYDDRVLADIIPLCDDSDIIGITLMTNFFESTVQITRKIKSKLDKPVIWGGIHPTVCPEESLKYADAVCIGEGEEATRELLDKMERREPYYEDIRNVWFKKDGEIVRNPMRGLTCDLDAYPVPDYSFDEHYLMFQDKILPLSAELLKMSLEKSRIPRLRGFGTEYQTMTSRGCPHKCSYCANDALKSLYCAKNYLRWRSTKHIINELLWVRENLPCIGQIMFYDDSFFARNKKDLKEFCGLYKRQINLPFYALGSPMTITDEKMDMLVDAGLTVVQLGIQTGSQRMLEVFNRHHMTPEKTMGVIRIINKYKDRILPPYYDFMLDSPFESNQDKIETLRYISHIPKPFRLSIFATILYPGTQLYNAAKADGVIKDELEEIYRKSFNAPKACYLNFLFFLAKRGRFPGWLLRLCVSAPVVWILNMKIMNPVFASMRKVHGWRKIFFNRMRRKK